MCRLLRCLVLAVFACATLAAPALGSGHQSPGSGSTAVAGTPFPSNRFTVADRTQRTGRRVALPKPDCAARPSDCRDIDVLNRLDGFNLQPRLSIPFTAPIDVSSVSTSDVFLVSLDGRGRGRGRSKVVGLNQIVWDPATNTLHAESDELLDEDTTYALVVTTGVRDTGGAPIAAARDLAGLGHGARRRRRASTSGPAGRGRCSRSRRSPASSSTASCARPGR